MTMTCEQAIELLPWLLNGTLEEDERRQVLGHLGSCAACRAALADTRTALAIFDWHPPAAALVAHAARAPEAAREEGPAGEIEEHLAACARCAAELELVRTSRLLAEDEERRIVPLQTPLAAPSTPRTVRQASAAGRGEAAAASRAWRRSALAAGLVGLLGVTGWFESARHTRALEERLARLAAPAPAAVSAPSSPSAPGRATAPAPAAGAATPELRRRAEQAQQELAALASQNRELQQQVAELGRTAAQLTQRSAQLAPPPRLESAWAEELYPTEQTQRGAEPVAPMVVPLSSGIATLLLRTQSSGAGFDGFELEIHDPQGRPVGATTAVVPRARGGESFAEFDVSLRRGALPPGSYTLRLFGRSGRGRETLATYAVRVS
jgi:predicted anti-sigma-YlaC factor YlaD